MKKILCIFLSLVIMLVQLPLIASAQDTHVQEYNYESDVLKNLGIIDRYYDPKELITRGVFAKIVAAFANVYDGVASRTPFEDIAQSNEKGAIAALYDLKIMNGTSETTFSPDSVILYQHAQTALLRALGYGALEQNEAIVFSTKSELTKGIAASGEQLCADMLIPMIYNALDVKTLYKDLSDGSIKVDKTNALRSFHKIYEFSGVYQANNKFNITGGSTTGNYEVVIDGEKYKTKQIFDTTYIGCLVDCFVDCETDTIIAMVPSLKVNFVQLRSDIIGDFEDNCYLIFDDNGRKTKYEIDEVADVIKNDKVVMSNISMIPASGYVSLTDNDGDGDYDLVNIAEYINLVVSGMYTDGADKIIYDSNTGTKIKVINDGDDATVVTDINGKNKSVSSIREKALLAVKGNIENDEYIATQIIVCSESVKGVLKKIGKKNENSVLLIGEKEYITTADFSLQIPKLIIGMEYEFYIDNIGMIAAVDLSDKENLPMAIGYIIKANDNGIYGNALVKMLTPHDKVLIYETADEVLIDGNKQSGSFSALIKEDALGDGTNIAQQLVSYKLNEKGQLARIDKSIDYTDPQTEFDPYQTPPQDLPLEFGLYKTHDRQLYWYGYHKAFYEATKKKLEFMVDDSTLIYAVPDGIDDTDEEYVRLSTDEIADYTLYDVQAYSLGIGSLTANVILLKDGYDNSRKFVSDPSVHVVSSIVKCVNENDDVVSEIKVVGTDGEATYLTESEDVLNNTKAYGEDTKIVLSEGDLIRLAFNSDDEICGIEVVYDYNGGTNDMFYGTTGSDWINYNASFDCVRAKMYRRSSKVMQLVPINADMNNIKWTDISNHILDQGKIVICEEVRGKLNVRIGTKSDIRAFVEDGVADEIIYHTRQSIGQTIVVYK